MMREWLKTPAMRAAVTFVGVSAVILVVALVRAVRPAELPKAESAAGANVVAQRAPVRPAANIQVAVEHDLFSPDRLAPEAPYRLPTDPEPGAAPERVEPRKPALLGTVIVSTGKNFATVQLSGDSPKLVRAGDKIGEWTVRSIARGKVVIEGPSGRVELTPGADAPLSGR